MKIRESYGSRRYEEEYRAALKSQYIISDRTAVLQNSEKWVMLRRNCR